MPDQNDVRTIRELAAQVAELAALPVQEEKKELWRRLNGLDPVRPMVMIDQIPWDEMNIGDELTLQCEDPECRDYEWGLRTTLYRWRHFPVDMVVEPFIRVPKAVRNSGFGIDVQEETVGTSADSKVVSHCYENLFTQDEDLEKIQTPEITHDRSATERRLELAHELFDGLLEIKPWGVTPYLSLWDPIATWMSAGDAIFALMDRPEFMHALLNRMTEGYLTMLDQLEGQGLLCEPQSIIHCTGAWTNELPAEGYDPEKPRTKDIWMFGLAQMLAMVSPEMYQEFEVEYSKRICERFGLVYYGCCDPLHGKMAQVRSLPNVRKVSMSPWADHAQGAAEIGRDYVFSAKPNPAHVAMDKFDADLVRAELMSTRKACRENGSPLEYILKDISTVCNQPDRLAQWARIAMEVATEQE